MGMPRRSSLKKFSKVLDSSETVLYTVIMDQEKAERKAEKMMGLAFAIGEMHDELMSDAKCGMHYTKENKEICESLWEHNEVIMRNLKELAMQLDRAVLIKSLEGETDEKCGVFRPRS